MRDDKRMDKAMRTLQDVDRSSSNESNIATVQGLAGWVLGLLRVWNRSNDAQPKQLKLIEALALGGKKQLLLVSCGRERFLVGGGLDTVETIVRVRSEETLGGTTKNMDDLCR
jgi:flagellar biogenesis protein FliO